MSIFQIVNQNSYTFVAAFVFLIALIVVVLVFRQVPLAWGALGALAILLIAGDLFLRVGVSEINTAAQFDQVLAARQPVVLEIYSNY